MHRIQDVRRWVLPLAGLATAAPAFAQDAKLAAAQKEGSLTLYTSFAEKDLPPLTAAFEKEYGVKVKVWRAGSEKVLQRTLAEAAARRYEVDAIHSSALEMETLHREKILQPVASPYSADLIAGALRPHGEWVATYLSVWVQAYNTHLVKKEDLPGTFQDLLDPKWKGKLGIEANVPEWYSTVVLHMGQEQGCGDRLVRAGAGGRAHERHRHRTPRTASEHCALALRLHAVGRGAADPAVDGLHPDEYEGALAARHAAFHAGGPGGRAGP